MAIAYENELRHPEAAGARREEIARVIWNGFARMGGDFDNAKGTVAYEHCCGVADTILSLPAPSAPPPQASEVVEALRSILSLSGGQTTDYARAIYDIASMALSHTPEDGWTLAPAQPTEAMWQAGREADVHPGDSYTKVYCAMLAAAPIRALSRQAPQPADVPSGEWRNEAAELVQRANDVLADVANRGNPYRALISDMAACLRVAAPSAQEKA